MTFMSELSLLTGLASLSHLLPPRDRLDAVLLEFDERVLGHSSALNNRIQSVGENA